MDRLRVDEYDITGKHEFLITHEHNKGILSEDAKRIPDIRAYINDLAETAGTFQVRDIDGIDVGKIDDRAMEFVGSWQQHDEFCQGRERWINPTYIHIGQYPDSIVYCDCGAKIVVGYEKNVKNGLINANEHESDCKQFDRLRARAELNELRYNQIRRLSWMGWRGSEIAPRMGIPQSTISATARDFGVSIDSLYAYYHQAAAKTYHYCCTEHNVDPELVADIYGHTQTYMRRLERKYVENDQSLAELDSTTVPASV